MIFDEVCDTHVIFIVRKKGSQQIRNKLCVSGRRGEKMVLSLSIPLSYDKNTWRTTGDFLSYHLLGSNSIGSSVFVLGMV